MLHTSPRSVTPVLDAPRDRYHPGLRLWHTVEEELLGRGPGVRSADGRGGRTPKTEAGARTRKSADGRGCRTGGSAGAVPGGADAVRGAGVIVLARASAADAAARATASVPVLSGPRPGRAAAARAVAAGTSARPCR
ncbi:hypothetical protein DDQ41_29230 [Streptomyces spongiicola]|uniref:Uncharacterized protein n=1 Tax=Streptomyces spongiicola TaxID=1690221 RepID=A0ABM6VFZ8_9ACTN|nr:hypothetical protein DDQ41_29230 [Streptomyces spongiicola]